MKNIRQSNINTHKDAWVEINLESLAQNIIEIKKGIPADKKMLGIVKADALAYYDKLADDTTINNYVSRIKSSDSIELKSQRHPDLRFQSVFNDILGIRIHCSEYPVFIPDYYRIVDLRKGKADDDGYRGIHLYYK